MDTFFIILSFIILIQSIYALGAVLRLMSYALRPQFTSPNRYQPKAVIIVPCKGLEHDFEENIRALFQQDYRDYEIVFVTESESDPAYPVLSRLIKQSRRAAWMVVAGESRGRGQKVHNLCAAIEMLNSIDRRAEVLVFADSDARVNRQWLSALVLPLFDKRIGATTGFRWYLPVNESGWGSGWLKGSISSILLSIWNASSLSLLGERSSFAWGGSMAIRREHFDKLDMRRRWEGSLSDDYALSAALHEAGLRIKFVPQCLVATYADAAFKELLEFTTRQICITRVYSSRVWTLACITNCLYNLTFWGGIIWLTYRGFNGSINPILATTLTAIFALGAMTGLLRAFVAGRLLRADLERVNRYLWAYALLGPIASLVYFYNLIASAKTRRIVWRGIGYEMISPNETTILHRPAHLSAQDPSSRSTRRRKASVRSSSQK